MPTTSNATHPSLEAEVASLLNDLLAGQGELMAVLNRKRNLLGAMDHEGLAAIAGEEQRLLGVLQDCLARRQALLARAAGDGLPSGSIQALANALPPSHRVPLSRQVAVAGSRAKLLQTQNLTNWIVIQRTLIHLSQLLEIIATGGRIQPTYGKAGSSRANGALLNQEA
jgi:flagellar biosynthesis/type III secretory pathway chaperone